MDILDEHSEPEARTLAPSLPDTAPVWPLSPSSWSCSSIHSVSFKNINRTIPDTASPSLRALQRSRANNRRRWNNASAIVCQRERSGFVVSVLRSKVWRKRHLQIRSDMLGYEGSRSGKDRGCPWSDVVASEMNFVERGSGGGCGGTDILHAALCKNIIGGGYLSECVVRMRPRKRISPDLC